MNTARWVIANHMFAMKERRWMRNLARFCGSDRGAFREDEKVDDESLPSIIPLAALLNPEVYSKFAEQEEGMHTDSVSDSIFEQQADALEKAGLLSDIDVMTDMAEQKYKEVKKEEMESRLPPIDPTK